MNQLTEEERKIIKDNWNNIINFKEIENEYNYKVDKIELSAVESYNNIILKIVKNDGKKIIKRLKISKSARIIKFIMDDTKTKEELIYDPNSILFLTNYFNMHHQKYKKKYDNDKILDISVGPTNYREIFEDPEITEIYDDNFYLSINLNEYNNYYEKFEKKVSDYYSNFSINDYSKIINNDDKIFSDKRNELQNFLSDLNFLNEKLIFILGCQKIGISFTIIEQLKQSNALYLNFEELFYTEKHTNKKKYIFKKLFNLFKNYDYYNDFIQKKAFGIKGYENILNIVESLIKNISNVTFDSPIYIFLDNYNDFFVDKQKLDDTFIEKLYSIIENKDIKIIILGQGMFMNNLLFNYFYNKRIIKSYIYVKYIITLNINIENIIHENNLNNNKNEIEAYLKLKYNNNKEYIIYNFVIIKNIPNLINDYNLNDVPFQFFKFQITNNKIKVDYQFIDFIKIHKNLIKSYVSEINSLKEFANLQNEKIKGYVLEDLIVALFVNNKTFNNLIFKKNNIIEVEEIFNMKNIKKIDNLEDGPILIIQTKNGEVFDFGFIMEENNIQFFVGGQIGLNKTREELLQYQLKIERNEQNIKKNIKTLTGRNIQEFRFLIIFSKEWQEKLLEEYIKLYESFKKYSSKSKFTSLEKNLYDNDKEKLNHFNSRYGVNCCLNAYISYIFFSNNDFKFYNNSNEELEKFDTINLYPTKSGMQKFIFYKYNLIPINKEESILTKKESDLLLKELIKNINGLININIKYKTRIKIPILTGTPINGGILSIADKIKIFTYYDDKFTHYLIKNNHISVYCQNDKLFDDKYGYSNIESQYYVTLIFKNDLISKEVIKLDESNVTEKNQNEENKSKTKEKKNISEKGKKSTKKNDNEKENYFDNELKFLNKKTFLHMEEKDKNNK